MSRMTQQANIETYRQEYERYREEYRLSNPPPQLRLKSPWHEWRFWIFGPVALFAPVVSGFRTFASFEHVAAILPVLEGLLGVVAVELGLIGYQIERIQRKARAGKLKGLGEGWLLAGVGLTLAIALLANVDLVLEAAGQPIPKPYRGWIIGGVVGGLVPLLGLIAGEVLGRLFYEIDQANQAARKQHLEELQGWEKALSASWQRMKGKRLRVYESSPQRKDAGEPEETIPARPGWLPVMPEDLPEFRQAPIFRWMGFQGLYKRCFGQVYHPGN